MLVWLQLLGTRIRLLTNRLLARLGMSEQAFLVILATLIGILTGAAAVAFHELIHLIRDFAYVSRGEALYRHELWILALVPAAGGLLVGIISLRLVRAREGHGVIDVIESVVRSSGFVRPSVAVEKIITSGVTIGSGGSAGAEGPIVQIGAAIASGVGSVFRIAREQMPILIGCGAAAGISAIFNAPIGGVLFALEVILFDFSTRTFTAVNVASVIANVTTRGIFQLIGSDEYQAIFMVPAWVQARQLAVDWGQIGNFAILGVACGIVGVMLTRTMHKAEERFARLNWMGIWRPAAGGLVLGLLGVIYVITFGWIMMGEAKPFDVNLYPMPAFFGDGYGIIEQLLSHSFYRHESMRHVFLLLTFLLLAKVVGTCVTLASGGSGGIIAPSLFLGAVAGAMLGIVLRWSGLFRDLQPEMYALVGMGAVLAAVVHAPMASILIVVELTQDYKVMVPAMLSCVLAVSVARLLFRDSIYTLSLRRRGVQLGGGSDIRVLRRLSVQSVPLAPASFVHKGDPFQKIVDLTGEDSGASNFVVIDDQGMYAGMVTADDIRTALIQREAVPLLLVDEVRRANVPIVRTSDDLASVLEKFAKLELSELPVCMPGAEGKVIGMIGRSALMRRYQQELEGH
jgi:CIC family chloride channel protein